MNTTQLNHVLHHDPFVGDHFGGACARDELPTRTHHRSYVINTDPSDLPGEHWVCLYLHTEEDGTVTGDYFDSYGHPPCMEIETFLQKNADRWTHNRRSYQGHYSTVCGHYCTYYLYHRHRGLPLDVTLNDRKVSKWFKRTFPHLLPLTGLQSCRCLARVHRLVKLLN